MAFQRHPTALVESDTIGDGTRIWAFVHVLAGAVIGRDCNIGDHCYIEAGAVIGDEVTIKNGVSVWDGVTLERGVFIGPNVTLTNDRRPRSRAPWTLAHTRIAEGATIGANATVTPGITVGAYSMVGAGAVVTRDVPPYALVMGNPARVKGVVCRCGATVRDPMPERCPECGRDVEARHGFAGARPSDGGLGAMSGPPAKSIPFVDLAANAADLSPDVLDVLRRVVEGGRYVLGPEVAAFEQEFAAYCGGGGAVGLDSGTSALELALRALGVGPGDEVITQANTFIATAFAIRYTGATPVLVDVDPVTYTLDPAALERAITPRTKAVVPVHLYGQPASMTPILDIAAGRGLAVVEDACQAHGARYRGRMVGSFGDAAAFSFYPSKNLGAFGDAGALVSRRPEVLERVRGLRDYGQAAKYEHAVLGYNRRLDELHAAVLRLKLRRLDRWNDRRCEAAALYDAALASLGVERPRVAPDRTHVYHVYAIRVRERDALRAHLGAHGIHTGIHYPVPVHLQPACADLGYRRGDFPVTEALASEALSLPMYPEISAEQIKRVVDAIGAFGGRP
ncbi:MAG: DegT/DnrJ/EryC1/StrS family aminotransferase [Candidatus Rokubacteria bacterium]|nr:DegT/DnrJ/EryC1/StrS family aminotransferase [Candidatus Rokubacteria bacterium]